MKLFLTFVLSTIAMTVTAQAITAKTVEAIINDGLHLGQISQARQQKLRNFFAPGPELGDNFARFVQKTGKFWQAHDFHVQLSTKLLNGQRFGHNQRFVVVTYQADGATFRQEIYIDDVAGKPLICDFTDITPVPPG